MAVVGRGHPEAAAAHRGWHDTAAEFRAAQPEIGTGSGFVIGSPLATAIIGSIPRNSLAAELIFAARTLPAYHSRYLITESASLVADEVGEGQPIPVAGTAASSIVVTPSKCGIMFVVSEETLADPDAGATLESDFSIALRRGFDAVILNRTAPDSAGGFSATANPMLDMRALLGQLDVTGTVNPIIIPAVDVALRMSTLRDAGGYIFGEIGMSGGQVLGCPAFTNDQLPAGVIRALNPEAIAFKMSGIEVSASRNVSVEMNTVSGQVATAGTGAQLV
jgi:hypothetical protein